MAELNHIIGAILRDVAQARVTSDLYSREVSRYYEQDSLLRLFPVPRSEISEIGLELRFSVALVEVDPERTDERDARIARIIDKYSEQMPDSIFSALKGSTMTDRYNDEGWQALIGQIDTPELRSKLKVRILDYFETNLKSLIAVTADADVSVDLKVEMAKDGIFAIVDELIYKREEIIALGPEYNHVVNSERAVKDNLTDLLGDMDNSLDFAAQAANEYKLGVEVTSEKLTGIPESAISSINITANIRNYTWSQVEEKDGKIIRRLVPE